MDSSLCELVTFVSFYPMFFALSLFLMKDTVSLTMPKYKRKVQQSLY